MSEELVRHVADLDEGAVRARVRELLDDGWQAIDVIEEVRLGVREVGERYATGEYSLAALIMSAEIFRCVVIEMLQDRLGETQIPRGKGKVLIGTVAGDIHDLGKNIVSRMLSFAGFEVMDLGVDVSAKRFVAAAHEFKPHAIGLSCLISPAFEAMRETIAALRADYSLETPTIMVGGAVVTERVRRYVGADVLGHDALDAVSLCTRMRANEADPLLPAVARGPIKRR